MDVYCPNCENACSERAVACPKCGHPLHEKAENGMPQKLERQIFLEIGCLRIIGGLMVVMAVVGAAVVLGVGLGRASIGWPLVVMLNLAFAGLVVRAVGGMWAALERISRK